MLLRYTIKNRKKIKKAKQFNASFVENIFSALEVICSEYKEKINLIKPYQVNDNTTKRN